MFNYDRNMVLAAFRAAHPDTLEVDEPTITKFDADLFAMYETELKAQATQAAIPINDFNRSMLVFFATQSGAKTVKTQVKHAVRFFLSVKPLP
jgi:hypothetical protein